MRDDTKNGCVADYGEERGETGVFAGYDETVEDNKIIRFLFVFKRPTIDGIEPAFYVDSLNTGCL